MIAFMGIYIFFPLHTCLFAFSKFFYNDYVLFQESGITNNRTHLGLEVGLPTTYLIYLHGIFIRWWWGESLPQTIKLNIEILLQRPSGLKISSEKHLLPFLEICCRTSFTVGTQSNPCSSSVLAAKQRIWTIAAQITLSLRLL